MPHVDFDWRGMVEDLFESLAPLAEARGIELAWRARPGGPPTAHGDPQHWRRLLTEHVGRALHAAASGELVLDVQWRRLGSMPGAGELEGRVRGAGHGSDGVFKMPLRAALPTAGAAPLPALPPLRVLVVEDNATQRMVLCETLAAWGMDVTLAHDAAQALDAARAVPAGGAGFGLVLLDRHLPAPQGEALLPRLQALPACAPAVVALLGAALDAAEAAADSAAGAYHCLARPVRETALHRVVAQAAAVHPKRPILDAPRSPFTLSKVLAMPIPTPPPAAIAPVATGPDAGAVASTALPAAAVLDPAVLAELAKLDPSGSGQLLAKVLKAFETSAQRLLGELATARRADDRVVIYRVAHTFKSSAAAIGALNLSRLGLDIETRLREGQLEALDARIDAMCAEVAIVLQAIAAR